MAEAIFEEQYGYATDDKFKEKKSGIFSLVSKSFSKASSVQLCRPFSISMKPQYPFNVSFTTDDKLVIIFRYKQKFVVYKKSNGTVAVLENAVFKQTKPSMMFDGAKMGALLHHVQPILTYAVANKDFYEPNGTILHQNDVVLVVARCREIFLGITEDHKVCFFPSEIVDTITQPRICLFEGMMLNVKAIDNFEARDLNQRSVHRKHTYEIIKGKEGLFDWFDSSHLRVPLQAIGEIGTKVVMAMDNEGFYHTIQELKIPPAKQKPPILAKNAKMMASKGTDVRSSNLENDEDIYLESDWKSVAESESGENKAVEKEGLEHSEKQQKHSKDSRNESLNQSSEEQYKPLEQRRDINTKDLYENQERIEDLKQEIGELRNALKELLTSQRDKNLKENEPLYDDVSDVYDRPSVSESLSRKNNQDVPRRLEPTSQTEDKTAPPPIPPRIPIVSNMPETGKTYPPHANNRQMVTRKGNDSEREKEIDRLLDRLYDFRDVPINDNLRSIVAEYVDEAVWHRLGKRIKVPVNRRIKIEQEKDDIYEKTYALLGHWHSRYGSNATLGVLLDALVEVDPEDLHLILEDICNTAEDEDGYQIPPT